MGLEIITKVNKLLPWAVVFHLSFGIWMLGNSEILETDRYYLEDVEKVTEEQ